MTIYYLIAYETDYPKNCRFPRADIRMVEAPSRQKARALAVKYERELNGGEEWTIEKIAQGQKLRAVDIMPWSEARNFVDFNKWPCNLAVDNK